MKLLTCRIKLLSAVVILLLALIISPNIIHAQTDTKIFQEANKHRQQGEWLDAINNYQRIVGEFPESPFADDAAYWSGYCMEKSGANILDAFMLFQELLSKYPNSNWCDDAQIHQLHLAQLLSIQGQPAYGLVQMRHNYHRHALPTGQLGQRGKQPAHLGVLVVVCSAEVGG